MYWIFTPMIGRLATKHLRRRSWGVVLAFVPLWLLWFLSLRGLAEKLRVALPAGWHWIGRAGSSGTPLSQCAYFESLDEAREGVVVLGAAILGVLLAVILSWGLFPEGSAVDCTEDRVAPNYPARSVAQIGAWLGLLAPPLSLLGVATGVMIWRRGDRAFAAHSIVTGLSTGCIGGMLLYLAVRDK